MNIRPLLYIYITVECDILTRHNTFIHKYILETKTICSSIFASLCEAHNKSQRLLFKFKTSTTNDRARGQRTIKISDGRIYAPITKKLFTISI